MDWPESSLTTATIRPCAFSFSSVVALSCFASVKMRVSISIQGREKANHCLRSGSAKMPVRESTLPVLSQSSWLLNEVGAKAIVTPRREPSRFQ